MSRRLGSYSAIIVAGIVGLSLPARAEQFPRWDIAKLCAANSDTSCVRSESENRLSAYERWATVAEADRAACRTQVEAQGQGYRRLMSCLGERALEALEASDSAAPALPKATVH